MLTTTTDESLVSSAASAFARYQAGDQLAFDELVTSLTPLLWHTVRSQDVAAAEAEDVVQTVWLSLVVAADSIRQPQAVVGWLLVTARREAWRVTREVRRAEPPRDATPLRAGTDEAVLTADRDQVLWRHVRTLPERERLLLRLIAFADRPDYAAVSEAIGMPVGSIGPTRGRCLAKLRSELERDPDLGRLTPGSNPVSGGAPTMGSCKDTSLQAKAPPWQLSRPGA